MAETTTIRMSRDTHARVTRLAAEHLETIDETVSSAIGELRQDAMARDLAADLNDEETAWLDAEAGWPDRRPSPPSATAARHRERLLLRGTCWRLESSLVGFFAAVW
jgi:hypothetical protein